MTSLLTIVAAVGNNSETKLDIQPLTSDWQQVTVWERLSASLGFRETQSCVVCIAIRNNFTLTNDRVYKWCALKEGSTFKTVCWKMKPRGSETKSRAWDVPAFPKRTLFIIWKQEVAVCVAFPFCETVDWDCEVSCVDSRAAVCSGIKTQRSTASAATRRSCETLMRAATAAWRAWLSGINQVIFIHQEKLGRRLSSDVTSCQLSSASGSPHLSSNPTKETNLNVSIS